MNLIRELLLLSFILMRKSVNGFETILMKCLGVHILVRSMELRFKILVTVMM